MMKKGYRRVIFLFFLGSILLGWGLLMSGKIETQDRLTPRDSISTVGSDSIKEVKIVNVLDGDTIKVLMENKEEIVRLIGIDTPEIVDPRKPIQCFGKEAKNKAKEMLSGKTVELESDPTQGERDEYKRLLRYVFIGDLNFNKLMIDEGYGYEFTFKDNPYKYQSEFVKAERQAKEDKRGLWQKCRTGYN